MKTKRNVAAVVLLLAGGALCAQEASIREFTGTVEVKPPGASEWRAAKAGERLTKDTMLSTGFKSTAQLVLGNSTLIVRPLTRLSLEEIQTIYGKESVNLYLQSGRIRAEVKPPSGGKVDFTIRSPSTTASVRGTSFAFNGEELIVDQGRVYVTGGDGSSVYVGAGHEVYSNPGTGKTAGAAETTIAELTPALPAAVPGNTAREPAVITPTTKDTGFGFEWH
jgi:hypothetical protein